MGIIILLGGLHISYIGIHNDVKDAVVYVFSGVVLIYVGYTMIYGVDGGVTNRK